MDWLGPLSQRVAHFKSVGHWQWLARAHKPEPEPIRHWQARPRWRDWVQLEPWPTYRTRTPRASALNQLGKCEIQGSIPGRLSWSLCPGPTNLATAWLRVSGSVFVYKMQGRPWKPWGDRLSYIDSNPSVDITTQYTTELICTYWARVVIQHNTQ